MWCSVVSEHYHCNLCNRSLDGKCDTVVASDDFYKHVQIVVSKGFFKSALSLKT